MEHLTAAGLSGIFLSIVIENMGIPFPVEASYLLACALITRGDYSYTLMLIVLTSGHMIGSLLAYGAGWWGEGFLARRLSHKPRYLKISNIIKHWYERYGSITIFATRFIGYVRPWSSMVAGFARVHWIPFTFWTLLGSLLFNLVVVEITTRFLYLWEQSNSYFKTGSIVLFVLSFSVIFVVGFVGKQRSK